MQAEGRVEYKLQLTTGTPCCEVLYYVESGRASLGHYIAGDGKPKPCRYHASMSSVGNLSAMPQLLKGAKVVDVSDNLQESSIWPIGLHVDLPPHDYLFQSF